MQVPLPIKGGCKWLRTTIRDSGAGISSGDLEKIFEPFYSKKIMGRSGTGLGMAVVWGMVKDHKGYIEVHSIEGKGTMHPGIDGLETHKKILKDHPDQKAIIASGFSETNMVKEAQRLGAGNYIKKPYTLEKIGLAVKEEFGK